MKSLRSRLIVGCALVALVPLAVAMFLLSKRVETAVGTQAEQRLKAALGGLHSQMRSDGERIEGRLQILARDPVLKRLYLLQPSGSGDLNEYLAERRFLLGLDFLHVSDGQGIVVGDGSTRSPASLAISATAPIRYEQRVVGSVSGGVALDETFLARLRRTAGLDLILRDGTGHVVAATVDTAEARFLPVRESSGRVEMANRPYVSQSISVRMDGHPLVIVTGLISTAAADQTIATLRWTSLLLGILGLGIAIFLGALWSSQVSRPVERLAAYSRKLAQGDWDEPVAVQSVPELQVLVQALDQMRQDLTAYREKLVVSERHAAWSQMARKVAHEVKNPLTPIAISIADLKRSYEQQRADFPAILDQAVRTIGDEVDVLKGLLQEFSDFARLPAPAFAPSRVSDLMADLETLYTRDVADGRLRFSRPSQDRVVSLDAGQIRQALVNLIKNGLEAVDGNGRVMVSAEVDRDWLEISVSDSGPGLTTEQREQLFQPGFTTKTHGSGLGLTMVERIVNEHQGTVTVDPRSETGTTFRIRIPLEQRL